MRVGFVALAFGLVAACGASQSPAPEAGATVASSAPTAPASVTEQTAAPANETVTAAAPTPPANAAASVGAQAQSVSFDRAAFDSFLSEIRAEALQKGIKPAVLDVALADVEPVMRIIERDRNQAEFKLSFTTYRDRVITPANVARGQKLRDEHQALLRQVAQRYGVQPRFILAIWGIETRYGAVKADVPLIHSLATLAYDRRRSAYFRNELFAALTMLDRGYIDLATMKGSWAGAMGQPQFMPTSYLAYAEDFDGDGRRDIWANTGDVFASIANYLAKHGWTTAQTWGREVKVPASLQSRLGEFAREGKSGCRAIDQMSKDLPLTEWEKLGVRRPDGGELPKVQVSGALVQPDGPGGPSFLVYNNYRSILRYNCAHHYALTVSLLADRLGDG
ncbi:lytic murein transglycosylase [uncultured Ferrovibrio sp.]|uniref:lytic murein transglycosylase n=1 Tax=uncultured Ferrovibrio sp. TaxID=1576913 RepID=UPI002604F9A6|nr:lytic murein transglycosylase [uncultured Ferrovibrio sp.]